MSAFERIKSGIPSLDKVLDNIRLGDNVVIQVTCLNDFKRIVDPFVNQSIEDKRNIIYIRFSSHEPLLEHREGLKIYQLNANQGFEVFTVEVHNIIKKEGTEAFYVFDSLSDLQVAWSTDLMMGNFFCVTCPYLFELDTVALFPVLRGHHDFTTIARIQETTQLFIDVHSNEKDTFIHPIKVWNRYLPDMYLPYRLNDDNQLEALTNSVDLADYYNLIHNEQRIQSEQNIDSYDRFFREAKESYYRGEITELTVNKIIRSMMTRDNKMASLIKEEFSPEDYFYIKERMIGTGTIGGKACGMLLARKMVANYLPEYGKYLEPQDSYYIGTDIFYSYIVENKLWKLRILQRSEEHYFDKAEELRNVILNGKFPESVRAQFRRMLDYFGQIPIIVRSSSFLEDGFGNAFAGKYESVFCVNACSPEDRLLQFEDAVRRVYASTMDRSALEYRKQRGLDKMDEQMAILVQRVSGTKFDKYYMPCAAGVGFSYSVYRWSDELSAEAGLLRLVAGLGTKAVDRTGVDYPRLVNLDSPQSTTLIRSSDKHRFSQRRMDVIDLQKNEVREISVSDLIPELPDWYLKLICEHDYETERMFYESGRPRSILFVSCDEIVKKKELMKMMKDILSTLEEHYGNPVDIEYTINFRKDGAFTVNILQCRPMSVWQSGTNQEIPEIEKDKTLLKVNQTFMGNSSKIDIDVVVWIDSKKYHCYPYNQKSSICSVISKINKYYAGTDKKLMLVSPGRIGTSSPDLGVPVVFSDISNFKILCEYADTEIGFIPELSYGSHMFQDIVETEMFYVAVMGTEQNGTEIFRKEFFRDEISVLKDIVPNAETYSDIIKVYEFSSAKSLKLYADFKKRTVICGINI
ncbi:PEP/pyruvate-binding domain-containing protein [Acetivibrio clariflavus]|uniref:Phosphoenolpyruvate synthase n=1 Tax=Acetivibrio clariflavus (strain DSM 19732 / NBRC 101661 / EBR45) TaxID=720554 RepID=G8LWH9_ACECE|nr:PEP/pyruvate-binding domain-containing protein [Acetivibrio clariflavus]AEV67605.1 phosphoenolpyruvate synthase/pyruvate phosphate dikinase [Acetivibrio clariflavus DSM 19732]